MNKLFVIFILILLFSCKTKIVEVPINNTVVEKEYVDKLVRDGIFLHDSIIITKKGECQEKEIYRYLYRDKYIRDSIFIRDSIYVEVPYKVELVQEVNRLKNWQIILMILGGVLIGYVGYRAVKWLK